MDNKHAEEGGNVKISRDPRITRHGWLRRPVLAIVAATLAVCALISAIAAAVIVYSGWYNVSAVTQHWQPVFSLLEYTMRRSVQHHAAGLPVPPLTPELAVRGEKIYGSYCLACHGSPGVAPDIMGRSMQPVPGPLVPMRRRWKPNELHWIIRNGIKMSGMPGWQFQLNDADTWALVAYLQQLPEEAPAVGQRTRQDQQEVGNDADPRPSQDIVPGRAALAQYACRSCHVIPGVTGSDVHVGPELRGMQGRQYIAGYLPNTRENLIRWIRFPKEVKPGSAMPDLDVSQRDAEDMAAYLMTVADHGN